MSSLIKRELNGHRERRNLIIPARYEKKAEYAEQETIKMYEKYIKDELQIRIDEAKQKNSENIDCSVSFATEVMALINQLTEDKDNAISQISDNSPRLLTLEEADLYCKKEDKYIDSENPPVYVEYKNKLPYNIRWLTVESLISWLNSWETRIEYGKEWRCWTTSPTEEQKKSEKWK